MKDLKEINTTDPDFDFRLEYSDPLLEYVSILARKYCPYTEMDYDCGYNDSKAIIIFVERYFENEVDGRFLKRFIDNKDVQETITALGYDIDKFWYLLLFVFDYSCAQCLNGMKVNETPKRQIEKFTNALVDNIEQPNKISKEYTLNRPTKIVLEIKRKHKVIIDDPISILYITGICINGVKAIEDNSKMSNSSKVYDKSPFDLIEPESNSVLVYYFAKMFLDFFELKPLTIRKEKSSTSVSKKLLISRLIYITKISINKNFLDSDDTLKGFLKQYKDYKTELWNITYM